jgi:hypothetical protein
MRWFKGILITTVILVAAGVGSFNLYGLAYSRGETSGCDTGYVRGKEVGYGSGIEAGRKDGYTSGVRDGEQAGYTRGVRVWQG